MADLKGKMKLIIEKIKIQLALEEELQVEEEDDSQLSFNSIQLGKEEKEIRRLREASKGGTGQFYEN